MIFTWGNVSARSDDGKYMVIKPSGVEYDRMKYSDMVVVDIATGRVCEGTLSPSSDTPTHLYLYRAYSDLFGIVHTHSRMATAFSQAGEPLSPLGTTHADCFHGEIPITRALTEAEISENYEENTGLVIAETFGASGNDLREIPGVPVKNHGVFAFGASAGEAVHNAVVLEEVAYMNYYAKSINPSPTPMPKALLNKHFLRKHGKNAYYGQKERFKGQKMKKTTLIFLSLALSLCLFSCERAEAPVEKPADVPEIPEIVAPPEPVVERVSFTALGDNIIYYGNTRDAKSLALEGGREYNFKPMFENVASLVADSDISFINQETLMAGEGYSIGYYPFFNSPQDLGYDLEELGFDVVSIANNHMLDKGADGLLSTIKFWKEREPLMIGGYEDEADFEEMRVLERNGIKIAFLSYTYGTNGNVKRPDSPVVIPYYTEEILTRHMQKATESAEFVIVSMHWGDEGAFTPNEEQKRYAQLLCDLGADVIIGHHPHVIQPVEYLTGKNGNSTLCFYSLGNFAAEQARDYNMVGGIAQFDIVSVDNGAPTVENVLFTPTVFHFPASFYGNVVYLMEDYTPALANLHGVRTYYGNFLSYEKLLSYAENTIDEKFLPEFFRGESEND